ncbi:MAG: FAD:protein FMN transferase [Agromyces sp.]
MFRWQFETMGTVASLVTDRAVDVETQGQARAVCEAVDARFSLYRSDSELSRLNSGEFPLSAASTSLRDAYVLAHEWSLATGGLFAPERPDRSLDLNGVVKAMAIAACVQLLRESGSDSGHVGIGGDGEAWGSNGRMPWVAGIVDPFDRHQLIGSVELTAARPALATSGSAERGNHIWAPPGRTPFRQVSVLGPDIVTADVLATAIVAGGSPFLEEAAARWPIEVLAVADDGSMLATSGWSR